MNPRNRFNPDGLDSIAATLVRYGLVSFAGVTALLGQIALALVLAVIAAGMFLRVWRLRRRKGAGQPRQR